VVRHGCGYRTHRRDDSTRAGQRRGAQNETDLSAESAAADQDQPLDPFGELIGHLQGDATADKVPPRLATAIRSVDEQRRRTVLSNRIRDRCPGKLDTAVLNVAGRAAVTVRAIVGQLTRMRTELARYSDGLQSTLVVLANTSATQTLVPTALADFLATHSTIDVEL